MAAPAKKGTTSTPTSTCRFGFPSCRRFSPCPFLPYQSKWMTRPVLYNGRNNLVLPTATFFHCRNVVSSSYYRLLCHFRIFRFLFFLFLLPFSASRACVFYVWLFHQLPLFPPHLIIPVASLASMDGMHLFGVLAASESVTCHYLAYMYYVSTCHLCPTCRWCMT